MKKTIIALITLCAILCISLIGLPACSKTPSEDLAYLMNSDKKSYSVRGIGMSTDFELVIPTEYKGLPVTGIYDKAFQSCTFLTSAVIHDNVAVISDYAFASCQSLKSVTIGKGVTTIGSNAFSLCGSLETIYIPSSVTYIDNNAFYGCDSLTTIYCQAKAQPDYWDINWNYFCKAEIVWDYTPN